jgi:hypothetical protein
LLVSGEAEAEHETDAGGEGVGAAGGFTGDFPAGGFGSGRLQENGVKNYEKMVKVENSNHLGSEWNDRR